MTAIMQSIRDRRECLVLATMLLSLHTALWIDFGSLPSRALILIHLGLFLLWQPVQRRDRPFVWYNALIFILITMIFAYWISWWLMFFWLVLLIGMVGGRVVFSRAERRIYFLALIFLILELLVACIPQLFAIADYPATYYLLKYFIAAIPLFMMFAPSPPSGHSSFSVDILYAITASMLTGLLAMGSLVFMYHTGSDYFTSLIQTLLVIGVFLILISWLLSISTGFSGLSQLWSRSLLNIGTPFEEWLAELSVLKQERHTSKEFLDAAIARLFTLPWMSGVEWELTESRGMLGEKTRHKIDLNINDRPIVLYTNVPTGGALLLHCNLLIQLIQYFYESKINEHKLAKQAHLQAIYETGARITHDIKNLLQSMHSMVTILQADTSDTDSKSVTILKRQFPYFIQRLEQSVDKLQAPQDFNQEEIYLKDWWGELHAHHKYDDIHFEATIDNNPLIPFDLFDSVAENLLENAISKRKNEPGIRITATIRAIENTISLSICDTGKAINENTTRILFEEPVPSDNGLGIGLLQAGKHAEAMGYTLRLKHNFTGNVCFELHN